ncbi:MAG: iron-sulfur cluster assembly scaffold protein [Acidobacteriota bacterium]|nr:iron-sulfur cluster assembly scaffold protein [Acidobacteriota bacterium]
MTFYPPKINEKFQRPRSVGKAEGANAVGTSASFACGAFVRFSLQIELQTKEILAAKFKSNGCGFMIAAADILSGNIVGKKLVELHGLDREILQSNIKSELENFPAHRTHCLELCLEALQTAFAGFRLFQIEEFAGEKALICTCFGVSEDSIEKVVEENSLQTVEEVTDACSAGGGCGSCQPLIQEILDVLNEKNYDIIENY